MNCRYFRARASLWSAHFVLLLSSLLLFLYLLIYLGNRGFRRSGAEGDWQDWRGKTHSFWTSWALPATTCFLYPHFSTLVWIQQTQAWSSSHSWSTPVENMQIAENSAADRVEIPTDGASEWEIDVKLLKYGNKVASGSYGDLWVFVASYHGKKIPFDIFFTLWYVSVSSYRGTYCSQDVAIKVLKPERINADMQREFAQEVYIMRWLLYTQLCFTLYYKMDSYCDIGSLAC